MWCNSWRLVKFPNLATSQRQTSHVPLIGSGKFVEAMLPCHRPTPVPMSTAIIIRKPRTTCRFTKRLWCLLNSNRLCQKKWCQSDCLSHFTPKINVPALCLITISGAVFGTNVACDHQQQDQGHDPQHGELAVGSSREPTPKKHVPKS